MKDWRNTVIGTLAGALVTFTIMFVSTTRTMVVESQLESLAPKGEVTLIKDSITRALESHTKAIDSLAKEVHDLREQVGRLEGKNFSNKRH